VAVRQRCAPADRRLRAAIVATALRVPRCRVSVMSSEMADQGQQVSLSELTSACTTTCDEFDAGNLIDDLSFTALRFRQLLAARGDAHHQESPCHHPTR
jgi:hypothetical protein